MNKKFTRAVCIVLAFLMLAGILVSVLSTGAHAVTQYEIDVLQKQRDELRSKQKDVQEQINALKSEMNSILDKKAALDEKNELNRQDIELINEQIKLYDTMISDKEKELKEAQAAEAEQFSRYCSRVRTMEETNSWSYISFLFEADSLTDFLSRVGDVMDIARNDRHVKDEYISARERVETVKTELEEIQQRQKEKRKELLEEKARLEAEIEAACTMIADLEDDLETFKTFYEENEEKENEVQAKIDKKVKELQQQKAAEEAARKAWEESQRKLKQQQQQQQQQAAANNAVSSGYFVWPVASCTWITSKFGYRVHPIFKTTKFHSGVDIGAGYGSTIRAAAGGTVSISEYSDSYGYYCVIYHTNGMTTLYAHMNAMPAVSVGQTVSAGQTIGYVGSTGNSTGPHLHFETRVNGSCVDPIPYFPGVSFTYASDA